MDERLEVGVAHWPRYGRKVVIVVADGHSAVNGLRWFGTLAKDEEHLLVDLQTPCQPDYRLRILSCFIPKNHPRLRGRAAQEERSKVLVVRHSVLAFPASLVVSIVLSCPVQRYASIHLCCSDCFASWPYEAAEARAVLSHWRH